MRNISLRWIYQRMPLKNNLIYSIFGQCRMPKVSRNSMFAVKNVIHIYMAVTLFTCTSEGRWWAGGRWRRTAGTRQSKYGRGRTAVLAQSTSKCMSMSHKNLRANCGFFISVYRYSKIKQNCVQQLFLREITNFNSPLCKVKIL